MIKRIQVLRNIGRFKNCKPGNIEFGRLSIIYGRNTYGKSTLGDVFASIQNNNGGLINGRMTIPHDGDPQQIILKLLPPNSTKEVQLTFDSGAWIGGLPAGLGIRTFDDGFIHRNVFVARQFNRDTKENFSAFILGEQGVQQAKAIAEKKQIRQKALRDRNQLEKVAFKDEADLGSFLKLTPVGTLEESEEKLQSLLNEHAAIRKQQEQIKAIHDRDEGTFLVWNTDFSDGLNVLNQTLGLGLEGTHKEAKTRVAQHINAAFQKVQYTEQWIQPEQWIRQGVRQNNGKLCQFCGQELTEDAHVLLELYRQAFDDAFDKHDTFVKQQLTTALAQVSHLPVDGLRVTLAKNTATFAGYPELHNDQAYVAAVSKVNECTKQIETTLVAIAKELPVALNHLQAASTKKQYAPHAILEPIAEASVSALESQVKQSVSEYNSWIGVCNAEIAAFKKGTNAADMKQRLEKIEVDGKAERRNNNRIILTSQCDEYIALNSQIDSLGNDIVALEKKLQTDQSDYLKKFFVSLNSWVKRFGSHDFTLERGEDNRGYTPIYYLKVKYKGQAIKEAAVGQIFSESDRRALALAVFWTQLQSLTEPERAEQIVVLDDPLTSFDDHRVTAVHKELVATIDKVRQIIVLSHYRHDIEMFFEMFRDQKDVRLLALEAGANGTGIKTEDPSEFLLTKHQKAHERLTAFKDGYTNNLSSGDLRIFFEAELNSRFAAQIAQYKIATLQLGEKIDKLFENRVIADDIKKQCHSWRLVLNPSHHTWIGADLENQRNTVRDFLDFVYNRLIREQ
jgi:wobble nucleotide-excising tRNase